MIKKILITKQEQKRQDKIRPYYLENVVYDKNGRIIGIEIDQLGNIQQ